MPLLQGKNMTRKYLATCFELTGLAQPDNNIVQKNPTIYVNVNRPEYIDISTNGNAASLMKKYTS